jgi:hypothetical protein
MEERERRMSELDDCENVGLDPLQARGLWPGIYRLNWVGGGSTLAAVGKLHDGFCWFAPINWTAVVQERIASVKWELVKSVEIIQSE